MFFVCRDVDMNEDPRDEQDGKGDRGGENPAPICRRSDTEGCRYLPEDQKALKRKHNDCIECYRWNASVIARAKKVKTSAEFRKVTWLLDITDAARILLLPCVYCKKEPAPEDWGSVERFNNNSQYARGTVVPSCWPCNISKGIIDAFEFFMAHRAIKYFRTERVYGGKVFDDRPLSTQTADQVYKSMGDSGHDVTLTLGQVRTLVEAACFLCGRLPGKSVDRYLSDEEYTEDNSKPICHCCNFLKKSLLHKEVNAMNDKISEVFTEDVVAAIPIRSPPRKKEEINIWVPRNINHILTTEEVDQFVFPDEINSIDAPMFVEQPKSTDNTIDGCGDIKTFDLPRYMSYMRPFEWTRGYMFQISKVQGERGSYSLEVLELTSAAKCVPTIVKLLQAICLYKKCFSHRFGQEQKSK
eukprot:GHVU01003901.1.p1 GENE.GHVU01003901.1~~GHVU01003901.1.p1  ORF type:complete len:413 (-),score=45.44 GHVU01003901.1:142-1380(-)